MTVQYNGYKDMTPNRYDTFQFTELEQSKQLIKKYTTYISRITENNRFVYTGTEIN